MKTDVSLVNKGKPKETSPMSRTKPNSRPSQDEVSSFWWRLCSNMLKSCDSPSAVGQCCCSWSPDAGWCWSTAWTRSCCSWHWWGQGSGGLPGLWVLQWWCWCCLTGWRCWQWRWWCGSGLYLQQSLESSGGQLQADNRHRHHCYLQHRPTTRQCFSRTSWLLSDQIRPDKTRLEQVVLNHSQTSSSERQAETKPKPRGPVQTPEWELDSLFLNCESLSM